MCCVLDERELLHIYNYSEVFPVCSAGCWEREILTPSDHNICILGTRVCGRRGFEVLTTITREAMMCPCSS